MCLCLFLILLSDLSLSFVYLHSYFLQFVSTIYYIMAPTIPSRYSAVSILDPLRSVSEGRVEKPRNRKDRHDSAPPSLDCYLPPRPPFIRENSSASRAASPRDWTPPLYQNTVRTISPGVLESAGVRIAPGSVEEIKLVEAMSTLAPLLCRAEDITDPDIISSAQRCSLFSPQLLLLIKLAQTGGLIHCWTPRSVGSGSDENGQSGQKESTSQIKSYRTTILEKAAREHGQNGRPLSENKLLAGYGNGDYSLGGRWASHELLDRDKRCVECKRRDKYCRIVKEDFFFTRKVCVECMRLKSHCSVNETRKEEKRQKRDKEKSSKQSYNGRTREKAV